MLLVAAALAPIPSFAADPEDAPDEGGVENRAAHTRLTFENVRLPGDERVGLVGTSYLVDFTKSGGWALGPAVYGAATGHRGGFFTFGGEAAWRKSLLGPFGVELGLYAGGGGGGGAPQGGGLMLRPHVDLLWEAKQYAFGLSVAKVKFPNGQIDSTQVGLVLDVATDFNFFPARQLDSPAVTGARTGVSFDRLQIVGNVYRTRSGGTLNDGSAEPRNIRTVGVRGEQSWGSNAYWGLEAAGAAQSGVAGYAEFLGTLGLEGEVIRDHLHVGARVALGMAGGGGVSVGGGLFTKAALYSVVRLNSDFGVAIEGGLADAPQGSFRAASLSASLVWVLDSREGGGVAARPVRTDFSGGLERFDAARHDGTTRELTANILKGDRFLSSNFYVSGQLQSAVAGGAGGFSAALIGAGWLQPLSPRWFVGAELLAGAAGGGGVDSHGSIVQPTVFAGLQITPAVGLRVSGGRVKSVSGPLSSNIVNCLLTVTYGVSSGG